MNRHGRAQTRLWVVAEMLSGKDGYLALVFRAIS